MVRGDKGQISKVLNVIIAEQFSNLKYLNYVLESIT